MAKPNASYLSYTTPKSSSSRDITDAILESLKEQYITTDCIQVMGCDETNVNTGQMAGVIRRLEESFNHPSQWLECLLHANELLLRHLFDAVDGATLGPRGFFGSIGERLLMCSVQSVSSFNPMTLTEQLSNLDPKELSTDQQ